jgi:hypothetical protein
MPNTISIPQYLADAFNVPVVLPVASLIPVKLSSPDVEVRKYEASALRKSRLGTYVYESLELKDQNGEVIYTFPDTVLIHLAENSKNIVRTPMQGKDGTVKEYIGMDDWQLRIMGMLINPTSKDYPEDLKSELTRIYERNEALRIDGSSLCTLGIHQIVFSSIKFDRKPGQPSSVAFTIEAYSDEPVELEILNS